jgi:hypothetical protein
VTWRLPYRVRFLLSIESATTHDPLFDSAWLKWTRAIVHSKALRRDIDARTSHGDTNPIRAFRTEYDPKRHGFAIVVEDIEPIPVGWRLLLGDIANNYRAALDHLAWALVTRGRTPPNTGKLTSRQEKSVYFPILEERLEYNRRLPIYLPGIRRADGAKVRWCQPYHRGARNRSRDPLVLLASINSGDKHRTIQPLWSFPSRVDIEVTDARDCVLSGSEHWKRRAYHLDIGSEVALMRCRKTGRNPQLEVQLNVASTPTIGNRISLREWDAQTSIFVFKLLRIFSEQPASIHEVGAELILLP